LVAENLPKLDRKPELLGLKKEKAAECLPLLTIRGITQVKYCQGLAHKSR
jgi:hypothetical protein